MNLIVKSVVSVAAIALATAAIAQDAEPAAAAQAEAAAPAAEAAAPAAEAAAPAAEAAAAEESHLNTEGLLPSVAADGCELHIWPAERMTSQTTGFLGGGLLDAAMNGKRDSSNQALMASALDSPSQLNALTALDLRGMLLLTPGTTIVLHEQPIERHSMNKVKTRRSDSTSSCYSELIVADVFFQKSMYLGRSLRTLFMFRDFGNDQKIDKEYKAWGGNGVKLFPPKEGEDVVAAIDELSGVFQKNFEEYAGNARKALTVTKR